MCLLEPLEGKNHLHQSHSQPRFATRLPHPSKCELYYVNRDTLFSYHKESELFLQVKDSFFFFLIELYGEFKTIVAVTGRTCTKTTDYLIHAVIFNSFVKIFGAYVLQYLQRMMALYVSSHYKNSPNDLQLMADAPAHHLFVLLGILVFFELCLLTSFGTLYFY